MTYKRELAIYFILGLAGIYLLYGLVNVGAFLSKNFGARVAIERAK